VRAIEESNFTPDRVAKSLRSGRTNSIGLVVSDTSQYVFGRMIAEVEDGIRKAGMTLLLANSGEDPEQESRMVHAFLDHRVDGIIIAPVADWSPSTFAAIDAAGCPRVLIDRMTDPSSDQAGTDNRSGMRALTNHLISIGHTDITLVGGDLDVWTIRERTAGFHDALVAAGIPAHSRTVLETPRGLRDGAYEIERFLNTGRRPTAVIAASGLLTLGVLRACRRRGISIPGDLALASFDGLMNAEFFEPTLTAALHPVEFIGHEATALLLRRMSDPSAPPRTVQAQATLVHGTSCGCPPGSALVTARRSPLAT
jgi:LacI family transcriptional regulator